MTLHNDAKLKYGTRVITDIDYVTMCKPCLSADMLLKLGIFTIIAFGS